ncbi:P-loop NTPase family protein [Fructobacillus ficulneus]|uniref:AAA ATPase domain protein n=1 Tax=Fructobacillus ficulneus TaxID=157463 RepID=A0A0K8MFY2_9LACO|nr:ATP-binding protein [Fructobacillus ficulneus]GAO99415.1 AAA ATPase domain protein [Fructobacillus ficulneus]
MKRYQNIPDSPFTPAFGKAPQEVIGRSQIQDHLAFAVDHPNSQYTKTLITGVRGGGKTTILDQFEKSAQDEADLFVISTTAGKAKSLAEQILGQISQFYQDQRMLPKIKNLTLTVSGLVAVRFEHQKTEVPFSQAITTFMDDFQMQGQPNLAPNKLIITVDEGQADLLGLRAIGTAFQQWQRHNYNVMIIVAGLPSLTSKIGQDKALSFLSRSARYRTTPLDQDQVATMYYQTFQTADIPISQPLATAMAQASQGYPYLVQLLGSYIWSQVKLDHRPPSLPEALANAEADLERTVYDLISHDLTQSGKEMLVALTTVRGFVQAEDLVSRIHQTKGQIKAILADLDNLGVIECVDHDFYWLALPFFKAYILKNFTE